MKIGLFYGSTTCFTEIAAEKIQQEIGEDIVELHNIKDVDIAQCLTFDFLIFGISTWDYGELQEDWESHWPELYNLDLTNKVIAIYGLGDQLGYTDWFQDAVGMLHDVVEEQGGHTIGYWPVKGYEFNASKALTADKTQFVGLALDEDNQYDLSEQRIHEWCSQILTEISEILEA